MENNRSIKTANILRNTARYFLLVLGILVFVFALFSGSENNGGGVSGIIKNSPNALPWFVLLVLIFLAWKQELVGGIIICLLGIAGMYFFNIQGQNFFLFTFILTLLIIILGSFFIISWYLRKREN
ncbi:hypothetical protein J7K93_04325 [bacterium]|nr:hypothetical protein [bacterium]